MLFIKNETCYDFYESTSFLLIREMSQKMHSFFLLKIDDNLRVLIFDLSWKHVLVFRFCPEILRKIEMFWICWKSYNFVSGCLVKSIFMVVTLLQMSN